MESYSRQADEFQTFGDVEDLPKYLKKAIILDNKLVKAVEIIDQFNAEEKAYGFEESNYPIRKSVCVLSPLVYTSSMSSILY